MSISNIRPEPRCQWDWLELPETPWGEAAYVLVGALVALEQVPRLVLRVDGPAASRGRHRRGPASARWDTETLAGGSDGDGDRAGHRSGPSIVRAGREALRRRGRSVPGTARQPQRRRREEHPLPHATVVAHRTRHEPAPKRKRASTASAHASPTHARVATRPSVSSPIANRCSRSPTTRIRRPWSWLGSWRRTRW